LCLPSTSHFFLSRLLLFPGIEETGLNLFTKICLKELCFLYESANERRDALIDANAWPPGSEYDDPATLVVLRFLYHELKYDVEPLNPTGKCTCCNDPTVLKKILDRAKADESNKLSNSRPRQAASETSTPPVEMLRPADKCAACGKTGQLKRCCERAKSVFVLSFLVSLSLI
jgi:hypothetical protein